MDQGGIKNRQINSEAIQTSPLLSVKGGCLNSKAASGDRNGLLEIIVQKIDDDL
jgi:hypothetical protein